MAKRPLDTTLLDRAIVFAVRAHAGTERRGKGFPYIVHPMEAVALGDKLSNMRAIARDYALQGDALWSLFHVKDRKEHEWHYRGLAASLSELSDTFAYQEFLRLINQVFYPKSSDV